MSNTPTPSKPGKFNEATLQKWLDTLDAGEPIMYVDLLSAIGNETSSTVGEWWRRELTERILEFADFFPTALGNIEAAMNRGASLVVEPEEGGAQVIVPTDLRSVLQKALAEPTEPENLRERFYSVMRTALATGYCVMCRRTDRFYPGIWPRKKKQEVYRIPFTMRMWFETGNVGAINAYLQNNQAARPATRPLAAAGPNVNLYGAIAGVCNSCTIVCNNCGATLPTTFDATFVRTLSTDSECPVCSRGKLTSVEPPKPNFKELKVYRNKFKDMTR